jgi:hypothetical protein
MTSTASDPLAEQLRRYYLQQLGITVYVPREPGNAPVAAAEPLTSPPLSPAVAVPAPRPAPVDVPRLAAASPASAEDAPSTTFHCLFAPAKPGLALLLQVPSAGSGQLSAGEQRLLANILHWLGWPAPGAQEWRPYRWPLPGLPTTSVEAGRRGLSAFLDQATREQPLQHLLVFGSLPLQQEHGGWQLWTLPGLGEMLKVAGLKRVAWQTLLPLCTDPSPAAG